MITTDILTISPATEEDIRSFIENEPDAEMKKAYGEMLDGVLTHPDERLWYTVWFIRLHDGTQVGDLCFKGVGDDGSVEIGYGTYPGFEGRGYMTEAVTAMTKWAVSQPGVTRIEAETEPDNLASQRVLEKCGFVPSGQMGDEGPRFVWRGL